MCDCSFLGSRIVGDDGAGGVEAVEECLRDGCSRVGRISVKIVEVIECSVFVENVETELEWVLVKRAESG